MKGIKEKIKRMSEHVDSFWNLYQLPKERIIRLLVVGDGNFSYSWQLIQRLVTWNKSVGRYINYVNKLLQERKHKRQKVNENSEDILLNLEKDNGFEMEKTMTIVFLPIFEVVCTSFDSREDLYQKYPESIPLLKKMETNRKWIHTEIFFNIDAIFLKKTLMVQQQQQRKQQQPEYSQMTENETNSTKYRPETSHVENVLDANFQSRKVANEYKNTFQHIIFNHPHAGVEDLHRHRALIRHFLYSCKELLPSKSENVLENAIDANVIDGNEFENSSGDSNIYDYGYVHISLAQSQYDNWGVDKAAQMFGFKLSSLYFEIDSYKQQLIENRDNILKDHTRKTKEIAFNEPNAVSSSNPFQFREKEYKMQLRRHHNGSSFRRELGSSYTWIFENISNSDESKSTANYTLKENQWRADAIHAIWGIGNLSCTMAKVLYALDLLNEKSSSDNLSGDSMGISLEDVLIFNSIESNTQTPPTTIFDPKAIKEGKRTIGKKSSKNDVNDRSSDENKHVQEDEQFQKEDKDLNVQEKMKKKSNKKSCSNKRKNESSADNQVCKVCGKLFLEGRSYRDHKRATGHEEDQGFEEGRTSKTNGHNLSGKKSESSVNKMEATALMKHEEEQKSISADTTMKVKFTPGPKPYYYYSGKEDTFLNFAKESSVTKISNIDDHNIANNKYFDRINKDALHREQNIMFIGIENEIGTLSATLNFLLKGQDSDHNNKSNEDLSLTRITGRNIIPPTIPPYICSYITRHYFESEQENTERQKRSPAFEIQRDWLLCNICNYYTPPNIDKTGKANGETKANNHTYFRHHPYDLHPPYLPPIPCIFAAKNQRDDKDRKDALTDTAKISMSTNINAKVEEEGCPKHFSDTRALKQHLMYCSFNPDNKK